MRRALRSLWGLSVLGLAIACGLSPGPDLPSASDGGASDLSGAGGSSAVGSGGTPPCSSCNTGAAPAESEGFGGWSGSGSLAGGEGGAGEGGAGP